MPADPALPMITLIAPPGWRSATSSTQRVLPGERPLLFPLSSDFEALDRTQALVPTWSGTTVQLSHFAAPADAGFAELSSGRLRAMRGDRALFFLVPPSPRLGRQAPGAIEDFDGSDRRGSFQHHRLLTLLLGGGSIWAWQARRWRGPKPSSANICS